MEELQVKELLIHCDYMLVVNHVTGNYIDHPPTIRLYLNKANALLKKYEKI